MPSSGGMACMDSHGSMVRVDVNMVYSTVHAVYVHMYVSVYMSIMCLAVYIQYIPYVVHCILFNVYRYMHCCSIDILCWVADTVGVGRLTGG